MSPLRFHNRRTRHIAGAAACLAVALALAVAIGPISARADGITHAWDAVFDRSGTDYPVGVLPTEDGGYIVLGTSCPGLCGIYSDVWLIKVGPAGQREWERIIDKGGSERANDIVAASDDGFVLLCSTAPHYNTADETTLVIRMDPSGETAWERSYDSGRGNAIAATAEGGYIVAGSTYVPDRSRQVWLAKLDRSGVLEWERSYGDETPNEANAVVQTADGGYTAVGYTGAVPGLWRGRGKGDPDLLALRVNSRGSRVWEHTYGEGGEDQGMAVVQASDGGFVICGETELEKLLSPISSIWMVKLTDQGEMDWDRTHGEGLYNWSEDVIATSEGGYAIVGTTIHSDIFTDKGADVRLIKTDSSGDVEWTQTLAVPGTDSAHNDELGYGIRETLDGGFIVVGESSAYASGSEESSIWLVKCCPEEDGCHVPRPVEDLKLVSVYSTAIGEGDLQRVFSHGEPFQLVVVIRNTGDEALRFSPNALSLNLLDDSGEERGSLSLAADADDERVVPPGRFAAIKFRAECSREDVAWTSSGFMFAGRKLTAVAGLGSQIVECDLVVDEFGIPDWLRNVRFVEPPLSSTDIRRITGKEDLSRSDLRESYTDVADRCDFIGFNCVAFGDYYAFGEFEANDPTGINHWFPASSTPYSFYNTPAEYLVDAAGGEDEARNLIAELVGILGARGLATRAYTDPNGLYSPDPNFWGPVAELLDGTVAHHDSDQLGWARFGGDEIRRLNYLESYISLPFFGSTPSPIRSLAVEVCPSGPSKTGPANADTGFAPSTIRKDLHTPPQNDPSFHYQEVKQALWIAEEYGFTGVCPDDTGRLIMAPGPAGVDLDGLLDWLDDPVLPDDLWTLILHAEPPSNSLYGACECDLCDNLREQAEADPNQYALDAYANMLKHMRWQVRDAQPRGFLMSGDYLVPTDVGWRSLPWCEDVSVSDQFNIWKPSFARWAYQTFNLAFRVLRTDLRRSLERVIPGISQPETAFGRSDLLLGVLVSTAWANRVHVDINDPRDVELFGVEPKDWSSTEKQVFRLIRMRRELDRMYESGEVSVPLYAEEASQKLLYHSRLEDPVVQLPGECTLVSAVSRGTGPCDTESDEPYAVLYSVPCEYGEQGRILHVMNPRVISDCPLSSVPQDFIYRIRVPDGEEVDRVILVSADLYRGGVDPDRDGTSTDDEKQLYVSDVTSQVGDPLTTNALWESDETQLTVRIPYVLSYTGVLVSFSEAVGSEARLDAAQPAGGMRDDGFDEILPERLALRVADVAAGYEAMQLSELRRDVGEILQNQTVSLDPVAVPLGTGALYANLAWPGSALDLNLTDPAGTPVDDAYPGATIDVYENMIYTIVEDPDSGDWGVTVHGRDVPSGATEYAFLAAVEAGGGPPVPPPTPPEPPEPELGMLRFEATGPVDLLLRDPRGRVVSTEFAAVDDMAYEEGQDRDWITIANRVLGDYEVRVVPEADADRLERYHLIATDGFDTVELADRKFIIHIPEDPYIVRSTLDGFLDVTGSPGAPAPAPEPRGEREPLPLMTWILIGVGAFILIGGGVGLVLFLRSRHYI